MLVTGGYESNRLADILKFNPATSEWEKTGEMKSKRYAHAVTVLPLKEVKP